MTRFVLICLGGAAGTGARYLLGAWLPATAGVPWSTFVVNAVGSFLIALVARVAAGAGGMDETLRLVLTTGVMGGFTTYSAFNNETLGLLQRGAWGAAAGYAAAMLLACLAAGLLGGWAGGRL